MEALLQLYLNPLLVFVFVLTRVSGLVLTAPIFGSKSIPVRVRAFLAVSVAVVITPLYWNAEVPEPCDLVQLTSLLIRELVLGVAFGLAVMTLFAGLQITGQVIGQMSGVQLADVFDPTFDSSVPVFGQLLDQVTITAFIAIGGHRELMRALLDSFEWMPPGQAIFPEHLSEAFTEITSQSFILGIRAAAPAIIALLLAVLITGLITRTLPQLNVMAIGFNLNMVIVLAALWVSLGTAALLFEDQAFVAIDLIHSLFRNLAADRHG